MAMGYNYDRTSIRRSTVQRSRIARTLLAANLVITTAALGQQGPTLAIDLAQVKAK